mgnify:CR=1 FL=1
MASTAIQAFKRTVTVQWPADQQAAGKALLLKTARDGHARIMREQGNPQYEAYANRPGNSNLDSVVLPGPIVYNYSSLRSLVETALDELRKASPVRSGGYVQSFVLFVNGLPVDTLPQTIKLSDEIMIVNVAPYARKIEIGKTESGRPFVIQVPDRVVERTAKQVLIPRYRNVAKIEFYYVTIPDAYKLRQNNPARHWLANKQRWYHEPKQRADRARGAAVRSPAIVISRLT